MEDGTTSTIIRQQEGRNQSLDTGKSMKYLPRGSFNDYPPMEPIKSANRVARPNDEERGRALVSFWTPLARTSSSINVSSGAVLQHRDEHNHNSHRRAKV